MDPFESILMVFSGIVLFLWTLAQISTNKHPLYFRNATAAGIVRLATLLAILPLLYVLLNLADPSVVGIYRWFYALLGAAIIILFGLGGAGRTGMRNQVDVLERSNPAAALLVGAFVIATGLIFAGANIGEADPVGDDEGGWWIPLGFFLAGWISLLLATLLYRRRDTRGNLRILRQIRDPRQTLPFALYLLSTAWILADAVAGDFYGWVHGLSAVGAIAGMLLSHELLGLYFTRGQPVKPRAMRWSEILFYIAWPVAYTYATQYFPQWAQLP